LGRANVVPVDERLDVGDCELDRRAVHRIGYSGEVGFQAGEQFASCLTWGFAVNPHFGKALMMNIDPRRTAGVAKILRHGNPCCIASHKSPFPKCVGMRVSNVAIVSLLDDLAEAGAI
jgi:hypothetical protein